MKRWLVQGATSRNLTTSLFNLNSLCISFQYEMIYVYLDLHQCVQFSRFLDCLEVILCRRHLHLLHFSCIMQQQHHSTLSLQTADITGQQLTSNIQSKAFKSRMDYMWLPGKGALSSMHPSPIRWTYSACLTCASWIHNLSQLTSFGISEEIIRRAHLGL